MHKPKSLDIEITSLGYSINSNILEKSNFKLPKTGLVSLIGENGAGKSSFLQSFFSDTILLNGKYTVNSHNWNNLSTDQKANHIAIVYANFPKIGLSVRELLETTTQLRKLNWDDEIIQFWEITDWLDTNLDQLSDGILQKVWIAKAFIQNTPILLLDEPFTHLDFKNKEFLIQKLLQKKKDNLILYSSHNLDYAFRYSDTILFIKNKKITTYSPDQFDFLKNKIGYEN